VNEESPIAGVLRALDNLDAAGVVALMAPDARLLTVDGRHAEGRDAVAELLTEFFGQLRSMTHRIVDEWHPEGVWIAEIDASYELRDWLELKALPRVFIVRGGAGGVTDMRVYGAHERPLAQHGGEDPRGLRVGGHWLPPL
jgi:SnoaL-like domain